tara:strand:+ start:362 stop:1882 length:1521 start_codon:yes stop_codon:yes gene_type:complete
MNIFSDDLPLLEDIYDEIQPPKISDNKEEIMDELNCNLQYFLDDYIKSNVEIYTDKHFLDIVREYLFDVLDDAYTDIADDYLEEKDYDDIVDIAMFNYFMLNNNYRSYDDTYIIEFQTPEIKEKLEKHLEIMTNIKQPEQRSKEWYECRYDLLTASDIWKALNSQACQNSLIYKKCIPLVIRDENGVNMNSAFHHGHKFEPLSTLLYEYMYDTVIHEYGCISHRIHSFLGASPDGINLKKNNERYGRMLEIKNPVSRELTGIPKKEYWIQMQLQMEVWDLNECDFFETVFKTYEGGYDEFINDHAGENKFEKTKDDKHKGVIIRFYDGSEPIYKYPPFGLNEDGFNKWYENCLTETSNLTWIENIYWYLKDYSIVLVPRNKLWFNSVLPKFKEIFETIQRERVEGYDHRKPNTRNKSNNINVIKNEDSGNEEPDICNSIMDIIREQGKLSMLMPENVNSKTNNENNTKIKSDKNNENKKKHKKNKPKKKKAEVNIIKIRTESFDVN